MFDMAIINPATCRKSQVLRLAGKIDKIVRTSGGSLAIMEHKTTGDSIKPLSDYWTQVRLDHQITTYWVAAHDKGHPVTTVIYDAIHKPGMDLKRATPEEKRQFKKNGEPYASTRLVDETPDEYRERLWADILSRPDFYFQRQHFPRTTTDVAQFRGDLWVQQKLMHQCVVNNWHPRNTGACTKPYRCEFLDVCNQDITEDAIPDGFVKIGFIHPELEDDNSTTSTTASTGLGETEGGTDKDACTKTIEGDTGILGTEVGNQCGRGLG